MQGLPPRLPGSIVILVLTADILLAVFQYVIERRQEVKRRYLYANPGTAENIGSRYDSTRVEYHVESVLHANDPGRYR
jgi:hypothetical protein